MRLGLVATLFIAMTACVAGGSGPTFDKIKTIKVQKVDVRGLTVDEFSGNLRVDAEKCLLSTKEIPEAEVDKMLLATSYLIQVSDRFGDRSFELFTSRNLKGNKGRYYENRCIYTLIQKAKM